MELSSQISVIKGTVINQKEERYSSTSVSGRADGNGYNLSSTVRHHQVQTFWIRDEKGAEHCYQFRDENILANDGHQVAVIVGAPSGKVFRVKNLNTGYYWRINAYMPRHLWGKIKNQLNLLLGTLVISLPFVNVFAFLASIATTFVMKKDFIIHQTRSRLFLLVLGLVFVGENYPLLKYVAPNMLTQSAITVPVPGFVSGIINGNAMRFQFASVEKAKDNARKDGRVVVYAPRNGEYLSGVALPWMLVWYIPFFITYFVMSNIETYTSYGVSNYLDRYAANT